MLKLLEGERVALVIRKHWFVLARSSIILAVLLIVIPPVVLSFLPYLTQTFDQTVVEPATNFILALYIMVLVLALLLIWTDYYLDMWIITSNRIIDIEQRGLFNREVAEIPLRHVQDVTIEIRGVVETFLKFGTLRIQTAGEREFTIKYVPHLYEAKDVILKYAGLSNGSTPFQGSKL